MIRRGAATALTCGLALTACSAGVSPSVEAWPTTAPSSAPSGSPTASPSTTPPSPISTLPSTKPDLQPPDRPAYVRGAAGQEAFATYVLATWAYALAANDPAPLVRVSAGGELCRGCQELVSALAERQKEGWSVYPFQPAVDEVRLLESGGGVTARVRFDVPGTTSYFEDGSFRNDSAPRENATLTVSMRSVGKEYRLVGFTIDAG